MDVPSTQWRRDCVSTPLRASINTMARSAVDAPVAMLRVCGFCPGLLDERLSQVLPDPSDYAVVALGFECLQQCVMGAGAGAVDQVLAFPIVQT